MDDWLGILRVTIAEAERFPNLSRRVHEASRNGATGVVSHLLSDTAQMLDRPSRIPFAPERRIPTAQIFMDLVLLPMVMRALMGDDAKAIRANCRRSCANASAFSSQPASGIGSRAAALPAEKGL